MTELVSQSVKPVRIAECPLQVEAVVKNIHIPEYASFFAIVETETVKIHAHKQIMADDSHVDPAEWSPLIYNFRHYFGLGPRLGKTFRSET